MQEMDKCKIIIMAGGSGTRLWPMSRQLYPKQFIKIFDGQSLLQKTLLRNQALGTSSVIVSEDHRFIAAEQIREVGLSAQLIVEPMQKNTAPCSIVAALQAKAEGAEQVVLLPADLYIENEAAYLEVIKKAIYYSKNKIATIGITPKSPHTGYGYIKTGLSLENNDFSPKIYETEKFVEKPGLETAKEYLASGKYFWNSGIFIYNVDYFLDKARSLKIDIVNHSLESFNGASKDHDFLRLAKEPYSQIESISIDYAFMEHIDDMVLIEGDFGWSDLGSWESLWNISKKDDANNAIIGNVLTSGVTNTYIRSENQLTAVVGLNNVIIINTDDALLVADKSRSEDVKNIVNALMKENRKEVTEHVQTFRPWGYYQTVDTGDLYKVKRIVVHPGQKLSVQYHHHRAEHWVIVRGVAEVQIGTKIRRLSENDSIYIPKGMRHRLTNIGEIDLHLVEVQTGHYLGEDDIVRIKDIYGR